MIHTAHLSVRRGVQLRNQIELFCLDLPLLFIEKRQCGLRVSLQRVHRFYNANELRVKVRLDFSSARKLRGQENVEFIFQIVVHLRDTTDPAFSLPVKESLLIFRF